MPYIIITRRDAHIEGLGIECVAYARRAVATLDGARRECWRIVPDPCPPSVKQRINGLAVSGDTVGPLPDGTVIEVERVSWNEIAATVPHVHGNSHVDRLIDAYNAREKVS